MRNMQLLAAAHNRGDSATRPGRLSPQQPRRRPSPLVSSLVLDDTRQQGPTLGELSSQLSGTVQHDPAPGGRPLQSTQIYEGTNQIQRMVIAKHVLS